MQKTVLQKRMQRFHKARSAEKYQTLPKFSPGFTLLELLVVILIIAALSAIAAPGWLTFLNRQRVSKVNNAVFSALQDAQREAKRTKLSYSVSFKVENQVPQVAVYPTTDLSGAVVNPNASNFKGWKALNQNLDIKPGQILMCSNIIQNPSNDPNKINQINNNTSCNLTVPRTITFDYGGRLTPNAETNLTIIVAIPQPNTSTSTQPQPIGSTKRCAVVTTLLGSMRNGQGAYNATNNPQGCL